MDHEEYRLYNVVLCSLEEINTRLGRTVTRLLTITRSMHVFFNTRLGRTVTRLLTITRSMHAFINTRLGRTVTRLLTITRSMRIFIKSHPSVTGYIYNMALHLSRNLAKNSPELAGVDRITVTRPEYKSR